MEAEDPDLNFEIEGPQEFVFWVKKALIKTGIQNLDSAVSVSKEPFLIRYKDQGFSTLEELVIFLRP